jgi:RHS repeat-associated protein
VGSRCRRDNQRRGERHLAAGVAPSCGVNSYESASGRSYDGNGNILNLFNLADGSVSATFEYSPFGETIQATGAAANVCPFGFSTKYTDSETSLVYYGFRYYQPSTGRWLSRDPIEERGGVNLYGFIMNGPIDRYDVLGLADPNSGLFKQLCDLKDKLCQDWQKMIDNLRQRVNRPMGPIDLSKGLTFAKGEYAEVDLGGRAATSFQYTLSFPKGGGFWDIRLGTAKSNPVVGSNGITDAGIGAGKNFSFSPVGAPEAWSGRSIEVGGNIQPAPVPPYSFLSFGYNVGNIPTEGEAFPAPVHTFSYGLNIGLSPMDWYLGLSDTQAQSVSLRDMMNAALDREQRSHDKYCKSRE